MRNDNNDNESTERSGRGREGQRRRGGGRGRRGGRMRRGDIRTAVLAVLAEEDAHGYQVIQTLEARTDGAWRPSPGSIYPLLQLLADSGLATVTEDDGKRVFSITDAGRADLAGRLGDTGRMPWERDEDGGGLRSAVMQLQAAARQVTAEGDPAQVDRAIALVTDARKALYGLLAE